MVTGAYHAATIPRWLPCGGREIIPYGVLDRFRTAPPREPPPPIAIFTSNPLRGLDWLLDLWIAQIRPAVPAAELHIYAGAAIYGLAGTPRAQQMEAVLARAGALGAAGVRSFSLVVREALVRALLGSRVMLYRGDPGETFCLALAEAQAMGGSGRRPTGFVTVTGCGPERRRDRTEFHATATASCHRAAASALKMRRVDRETRCR